MGYVSTIDSSKPRSKAEVEDLVKLDVKQFDMETRNTFGYPRNNIRNERVEEALKELVPYGAHNVGDHATGGQFVPNVFPHERKVMKVIYEIFGCTGGEENFWGYVEGNGTLANIWSVTLGAAVLRARNNKCDPVVLYSEEGHYSFGTAAFVGNLTSEAIDTDDHGSIKINELKKAIAKYPNRPIFIGIMCGTTVKEGRDNISEIIDVIKNSERPRDDFYLHVDGAYSAFYLALLKAAAMKAAAKKTPGAQAEVNALAKITPDFATQDIDSLVMSGHKFTSAKRTAGIYVTHLRHSETASETVEYIASVQKTLSGSRDGFSIYELWLVFCCTGTNKMTEWAVQCTQKAIQVAQEMRDVGVKGVNLNDYATTVYFPQPSRFLMDYYHLAPHKTNCHAIVTPHTLDEDVGGFGTARRFMKDYLRELGAA